MGISYGQRLDSAVTRVLVDAMDERGLSLAEVAERTHIPRRTLHGVLREGRQIKIWHLCAISDALELDCGDVLRQARRMAGRRA
jgi:predicted transcriptional regulator